ncbi:hypothetical protein POTOM_001783 [Populus tomentosa]|uniref:Uncharacterized protein n=1 Tax=Populus tomentosa TaxID=118781 RepID=A0A8X8IVY2_POPTO|nr:hypothetical protein POTOM_001783 [Populus tomentosa]
MDTVTDFGGLTPAISAIRRTYPSTATARGEERDGQALLTVDGPTCCSRWRQRWWCEGGFPNIALMEDERSTLKLGTTDAGGCYFRRGGNDIRVLSAAADLCLLLVARAIDGFMIARELE